MQTTLSVQASLMDAIRREDAYYYFGEPRDGNMSPLTPLPTSPNSPSPPIPPSSPCSTTYSRRSSISSYSDCSIPAPVTRPPTPSPGPSRKRRGSDACIEDTGPVAPRQRKRKCYESDKAAATERRRIRRAAVPPTARKPAAKLLKKHAEEPLAIETLLNALNDLPITSTGYIGRRTKAIRQGAPWTLKELLEDGFDVFDWDGM